MILYLAGLKGVDPALREAAAIDGANERQAFFRVVFPAMRPINIVVVVDHGHRVAARVRHRVGVQQGPNGLELISALVIQNLVGEGQASVSVRRSRSILLVVSLVPIVIYLSRTFGKDEQP